MAVPLAAILLVAAGPLLYVMFRPADAIDVEAAPGGARRRHVQPRPVLRSPSETRRSLISHVVSVARSLERRLERLIEGVAGRVFSGRLHPSELAGKLAREADFARFPHATGPATANVFIVQVNPKDLTVDADQLEEVLAKELTDYTAEEGLRLEGPVAVRIESLESVAAGRVECHVEVGPGPPVVWARLTSKTESLDIGRNRVLIGRSPDADVVALEKLALGCMVMVFRRLAPFLAATPILFFIGGALVYYVIFPFAATFFIGFEVPATENSLPIQLEPKVNEYLSLLMQLIFAFGLCFQLPVIMTLLARVGLATSKGMAAKRKYAIVGVFIVAAIFTPPDQQASTTSAGLCITTFSASGRREWSAAIAVSQRFMSLIIRSIGAWLPTTTWLPACPFAAISRSLFPASPRNCTSTSFAASTS